MHTAPSDAPSTTTFRGLGITQVRPGTFRYSMPKGYSGPDPYKSVMQEP